VLVNTELALVPYEPISRWRVYYKNVPSFDSQNQTHAYSVMNFNTLEDVKTQITKWQKITWAFEPLLLTDVHIIDLKTGNMFTPELTLTVR